MSDKRMDRLRELSESRIRNVEVEFEKFYEKDRSFIDRAKSFVKGETEAGRTVGIIFDVVLLPFTKARTARELARIVINRKQKVTNMALSSKKWYQSKTVWSAVLILLITVLNVLGLDFVNDPEVMTQVWNVSYALAGALGLYGLRDAIDKQRDEK